jgi:hypothetical protein
VRVHCAGSDCAELLGEIGSSLTALQGPRLVWRIQPGWAWTDGCLTFNDFTLRQERHLLHETTGRERMIVGAALARECDLPLRVRCPACHRVRWVTPDLVLRANAALSRSGR